MSKKLKSKEFNVNHDLLLLGEKLGFDKENILILQQALTHPTHFEGKNHGSLFNSMDDNQRLEFLGDAVLDLVISEYLYKHYPNAREGKLSKMRAYLVCEGSFAEIARKLGLEKKILMGKGAIVNGDKYRPSVQAAVYEAVIGAVFLTHGYQNTKRIIIDQIGEKMAFLSPEDYKDKKGLLQELVQTIVPYGVAYKVLSHSGPDHQPYFETGVYCGKYLLGKGTGGSKKESEMAAAEMALKNREHWLNQIKNDNGLIK